LTDEDPNSVPPPVEPELAALRRSLAAIEEGELARLLGSGCDGSALLDRIGTAVFAYQGTKIIYANDEALRISGFPREELEAISMLDLVHPEDRSIAANHLAARLAGEEVPSRYVVRLITRSGEIRWISLGGHLLRINGEPTVLAFGNDVTELKLAQASMLKNETLFRALAETTPAAIFLHQGARMTYANPAAVAMSGYSREDLLSMGFWETVHPDYRQLVRDRGLARLGGEKPPTPYEIKIITRSGEERWLEIMGTPLTIDGEASVLGTAIDVTYRKRAEEEMLRAQKLESLGVLAGGIAHDFNNLMTSIMGNLSLAKTYLRKGTGDAVARIDSAEAAVASARHLTQQLLTFSRGGQPVMKRMGLATVLEETAALALSGARVEADLRIPADLPAVHADEGQIGQVISNLVINGVQAMPDGGRLLIEARDLHLGDGEIHGLAAGRYVEFAVTDTGMGIPEEHLRRIFDPYFTTKPGRTGLGLSACYSIVRKHAGEILVDSAIGKGTIARVILPAVEGPAEGPPRPAITRGGRTGRILVMDDDDSIRTVAICMLAEGGYLALGARDGAEAISMYRDSMADPRAGFDAVILDLTVPGGMGGKDAMAAMAAIDPGIKALVSSGYSDDPILSEYRRHGFSGVIAKPYSNEELIAAVGAVLSGRDMVR